MYPQPRRPEPHFLEKDLVGWPIWAHLLLGVATLGLYFLILPFVWLYATAQLAFAKMIAGAIVLAAGAVWYVVRTPVQALYRYVRRLQGYRAR